MGNESDTNTKTKTGVTKDNSSNYITFEKVQESLNLSNPKLFKKYLHEVFQDLYTQSEQKNIKYISRIIFHDYIKLPIFISDKLFNSFKSHIKEGLLETEFVSGFYQLYMGNFEETTKIIFNLLDFDKDSFIQKEDVKLFLAYLLLDDFNNNRENIFDNETVEKKNQKQIKKLKDIDNLINKTFKKNNINLEEFISILKKNKSDVFLQILCFFYSKKPFSEKNVEYLKSKYMNDEEYIEISNKYIYQRKSTKSLIISPTKENNNSFINRIINKSFRISPKNSNENSLIKKYDSTPIKTKKGHHRYGSCGEFVIDEYNNYVIEKKEIDKKIINTPLINDINYEQNSFNDNNIYYENYIFKISENNKISKFYLLLIKNDIYYFKTAEKKELMGMHNLSSCFLIEYENKGEKIIDNITYYSFSLNFKSNSKLRKFYTNDILIYTSFITNIKKSMGIHDFSENYEIKESIGEGRNSSVNIGIKKDTGENVTIKTIKKNKESKNEEELIHYEIDILKFCQHKNIVQLIDYFENMEEIIIVLKYIKGNTLGNFLKEKNFNLNESEVANIIYQIAQGVKYLHKFGIVHRDLKPDNIMIIPKTENNDMIIKIMDFGFSKIVSKEEKLTEGFGTLYYAAPELIQNLPYNIEIDLWSLGVIIYYIFTGCYPFNGKIEDEIEEKILEENVEFKDGEWEVISEQVQDLIIKCLEKNPEERITIDEFINHPWFQILNKKKNR